MEFLIADTFTESLAKLTGEEQKATKTTAFDLQLNPATPSMSFHRIDKSKDKNFWSARVSTDIRLIVHKSDASFLLCYVDHHDKAYDWALKRKLETHPRTGAAQLVEIRETVQEVIVLSYVQTAIDQTPTPVIKPLFINITDDGDERGRHQHHRQHGEYIEPFVVRDVNHAHRRVHQKLGAVGQKI